MSVNVALPDGLANDSIDSTAPLDCMVAMIASQPSVLSSPTIPGRRHDGRRPGVTFLRSCLRGRILVLGVRLQDEIAHPFLRGCVSDGPEQRKAPPIATDGVLA